MEVKRLTAEALVRKLGSESWEEVVQAVREVRLMAKWDMGNRACMAEAGAIPPLVRLLSPPDAILQENAALALLNLSISPANRHAIMSAPGFLRTVFEVIATADSIDARRNSAALLFSIMVCREYRPIIGQWPAAIRTLLDLIRSNHPAALKDAVKCLFHISLEHQNRAAIVSAGAIPVFFSLLHGQDAAEDVLAVLAQVANCVEAVPSFRTGHRVSILLDLLETGTERAQENAASALLNLCQSGGEAVIEDVLELNTCFTSLSRMVSTGSTRAQSKASSLMKLLRLNQQQTTHEEDLSISTISTISTR